MDYRELLKKYMNMVGEAEGITYVHHSETLSNEEFAELEKIEGECC